MNSEATMRRRVPRGIALGVVAALMMPAYTVSAAPSSEPPRDLTRRVAELAAPTLETMTDRAVALETLSLPSGFLVWDEHSDVLGDARNDTSPGLPMEPELVGSVMAVMADDPGTSEDESSDLLFLAVTSSQPVATDQALVVLDVNGDNQDDYVTYSADGAAPGEGWETPIYSIAGATETDTGLRAGWLFDEGSYFATFDWRALGVTSARFTIQLMDVAETYDWSPDDYVGALIALPAKPTPPPAAPPPPPPPAQFAPSPPTAVSAVAGDASVLVTWAAPANAGTSPVTGYTVTATPGGASCTTGGLSCTVTGLVNQQAYTFSVVAISAVGPSGPSAVGPVVPQPFVSIKVKAKKKASVLYIDVDPNLKKKRYWKLRIQKRTSDGSWVMLRKSYKSAGSKERRTINLKKGTYRVVVLPKYGYQQTISPTTATLRK